MVTAQREAKQHEDGCRIISTMLTVRPVRVHCPLIDPVENPPVAMADVV
jgi:hypothetical protein